MNQKRYGECPRKAEAREVTVFNAFRAVTGLKRVPADRQYVTICGPMADGRRGLQKSCELMAAIRSKLIVSNQFVGVERDQTLFKANMDAVIRAFSVRDRPRLIVGDIADALREMLAEGKLRPSLVNIDTINEPRPGATLLARCLNVLKHVDGPVVVVWNTILRGRWRKYSWEDVARVFASHPSLPASLDGWEQPEGVWTYGGTGKSSTTTMGTIVIVRRSRAVPISWVRS